MLSQIQYAAIATVIGFSSPTDARRHLDDKEIRGHKDTVEATEDYQLAVGEPHTPLVQAQDCKPMCLFQDTAAKNSFCFKLQQPMMTAGWEWGQSKGTNYW